MTRSTRGDDMLVAGLLLLPAIFVIARRSIQSTIRNAVREGMVLANDDINEESDAIDREIAAESAGGDFTGNGEKLPPVLTPSLFYDRCRNGGEDEVH